MAFEKWTTDPKYLDVDVSAITDSLDNIIVAINAGTSLLVSKNDLDNGSITLDTCNSMQRISNLMQSLYDKSEVYDGTVKNILQDIQNMREGLEHIKDAQKHKTSYNNMKEAYAQSGSAPDELGLNFERRLIYSDESKADECFSKIKTISI